MLLLRSTLTSFGTWLIATCLLLESASAQNLWDIWQTTWNRTALFKSQKQTPPIIFSNQGPAAKLNVILDDTKEFQPVLGLGGTLTDSSAQLLSNMKAKNSKGYREMLNYLFSPVEDANAAGLSYVRVPLGSSDFSEKVYSYDDFDGDLCLNDFDIDYTPSYVFEVLKDIQSVNSMLRVHVVPWSPPAWMKDSGTAFGGSLKSQHVPIYAHYLFKSLQGFQKKGITPYAISVQNEPMYESNTHPSARFTPQIEAQVGRALKGLMKSGAELSNTKLIGFEHNWDQAGGYPSQLMKIAGDVFDGVAFHCFSGSPGQQDTFRAAYPDKEIYLTECSGTIGSDWWSDIKKFTDMFIGSIEHNTRAALMWNLALDGSGNPRLPGASANCGGAGCRGIVTVNSNGTWSVNQEFYVLAHISKGTIPRDIGGPTARRIGVEVQGTIAGSLRAGAYVTRRKSSTEPPRYSLVVLNWNDSPEGQWNPQPLSSTIEFRGERVTVTFPVGVTTLWWYASAPNATKSSAFRRELRDDEAFMPPRLGDFTAADATAPWPFRTQTPLDCSLFPRDIRSDENTDTLSETCNGT